MNGGRKLLLMIVVGILIAAGIIGGVTALEQHNILPPSKTSVVTVLTNVTTTSTIPTGVLAVQMTDPPNVPLGVSHLYVNYADIEAHTVTRNNSVWFTIANGGTIDLLSIVNVGQTIGSATVSSGVFDQARLDIINATVTFAGRNYTMAVPESQIIMPLSNGGVTVHANQSSGFVIEMMSTVFAASNGVKPSFELLPITRAVPIPSQVWHSSLAVAGSRIENITSETWFSYPESGNNNLQKLAGILGPNFLLVALNNTGLTPITISGLNILTNGAKSNASVSTITVIQTITTVTTITEVSTISANQLPASVKVPNSPASSHGQVPLSGVGDSNQTVATFLISNNGSLIQPSPGQSQVSASSVGFTIRPGQDVVFLYTDQISTLNNPSTLEPTSIIGGQQYSIQIVNQAGTVLEFSVDANYQ